MDVVEISAKLGRMICRDQYWRGLEQVELPNQQYIHLLPLGRYVVTNMEGGQKSLVVGCRVFSGFRGYVVLQTNDRGARALMYFKTRPMHAFTSNAEFQSFR